MGAFMYKDLNVPLAKPRIVFERIIEDDDTADKPDSNDEGFWPSLNKDSAGYVGENPATPYAVKWEAAEKRMRDFNNGNWCYVGVRAKARISIPCGNRSAVTYVLLSPGLWGIESDSGEEYLNEVFEDQKAELLAHIDALAAGYDVVA